MSTSRTRELHALYAEWEFKLKKAELEQINTDADLKRRAISLDEKEADLKSRSEEVNQVSIALNCTPK